jgi:Uncharacterised MFS-type transporter YbfB
MAARSPATSVLSLEGVGYIIAGTFLVAAINENSPAWAGSGAWVLVGLAAAAAAAVLRIDFPHRVGGMVEPSRAPNRARV